MDLQGHRNGIDAVRDDQQVDVLDIVLDVAQIAIHAKLDVHHLCLIAQCNHLALVYQLCTLAAWRERIQNLGHIDGLSVDMTVGDLLRDVIVAAHDVRLQSRVLFASPVLFVLLALLLGLLEHPVRVAHLGIYSNLLAVGIVCCRRARVAAGPCS